MPPSIPKLAENILDRMATHVAFIVIICIIGVCIYMAFRTTEGFESSESYTTDELYKKQVQLLSDTYSGISSGKRPFHDGVGDMPESDQILVNFYSLGCRFTGFVGPSDYTYYDSDIAVQYAVSAGCRTFVLEIDYILKCDGSKEYFPTLVVRDKQGKLLTRPTSVKDKCNSAAYSILRDTCEKINLYAFADSCQNKNDPVILVLYFLRQPPGGYNDPTVLTYFSRVAQMIYPSLTNRFLHNEPTGTYSRQSQEGQLLMNKLSDYNGKIIVCSNANTNGFREHTYSAGEDLDYIVNLRLSYSQTSLGITENTSGSTFGTLELADNYMIIPSNRSHATTEKTKMNWTICLSTDPIQSVPQATFAKITETYGVNCVPIIVHDIPTNQYMFTDKLFKTYSFIPKPAPLRYIKPPVAIPAQPSLTMDHKQGELRPPTV